MNKRYTRTTWMIFLLSVLSQSVAIAMDDFKWTPMPGSATIEIVQFDGHDVFKMPCNFVGTDISRASWDTPFTTDLIMARGMELQFYCEDLSPVAYFSFYLHSGDGWYSGAFMPEGTGKWKTVRIAKDQMKIEGNPAGFARVDTIRFSAWRGLDKDTTLYIHSIVPYGNDGKMVIIRNDAAVKKAPSETRSVEQYCQIMARFLDELGLSYSLISDADVTTEHLRGRSLVIMPHNPATDERTTKVLTDYLDAGGKLLACYTLPAALARAVGIDLGDHIKQKTEGYFSSIRPSEEGLKGMPTQTRQSSWNIQRARGLTDKSRVAAWWYDQSGKNTHEPAILVSDNCVFLTHVMIDDDPAAKKQLLLSMAGYLDSGIWTEAVTGAMEKVGKFGPYNNFSEAREGISQLAGQTGPAIAALTRAAEYYRQARQQEAAGDYFMAITSAGQAATTLVDAFCLAQKPIENEHRAFWCHNALGVVGMDWDQAVKILADNGFTAVIPNMLWGGVAYYPSEVLPVHNDVAEKGDQIALCLAACKKYGVECHVWKVNFNMSGRAPREFAEKMEKAGRVQVSDSGQVENRWLCPSHPANKQLEIDSMLEIVRNYEVDGIHFDYIRYPGRDKCFCAGCRERFEQAIGKSISNWPDDVKKDKELNDQWQLFRQQQITEVVATVAQAARQIRPAIKISAAVFPNWTVDRFEVGQDWELWCQKGYLDFVCPMDYTASNNLFSSRIEKQLTWSHNIPCYPGIGLSVWDDPTDAVRLIEQINITRQYRTGGFTIFNYSTREAEWVLPRMGMGITKANRK